MKENKKAKTHTELCMSINSYDDLFSDFDSRPFTGRTISDDFLTELRKQLTEADNSANELKLIIPQEKRKSQTETIIIERLKTFFIKKKQQVIKTKKKAKTRDIVYLVSGSVLMFLAGFISTKKADNYLLHALLVITEPTGWFLVWSALDNLINTYKKKNSEIVFLSETSKMKISFASL